MKVFKMLREQKKTEAITKTLSVACVSEAEFQRHTDYLRTHGKAVLGTSAAKVLRGQSVE